MLPTPIDTGHGGFHRRSVHQAAGRPSTRPTSTSLSSARPFIDPIEGVSCPTIQYKSGTRAYIESQGYDIVGDFGDQFSDLEGGFANKTFKMPNPNYYLP